ncbi:MAG: DUF2764 family protein [Candidatus Omnitrophica bacterium]|nr:DUF2764 family protein [Candidatus Omnitrophota bacterium]
MPSYYTYLISSLPMLSFGAKPPFSLEGFLEVCSRSVKHTELEKVREAINILDYKVLPQDSGVLKKWRIFNLSLRSELAHARAGRKKIDPLRYITKDIYVSSSISHAAMAAYRNHNILEAEKSLDFTRWLFLEEISLGHYFDTDFLIIYALKLKILIRWDKINNADKESLLREAVS